MYSINIPQQILCVSLKIVFIYYSIIVFIHSFSMNTKQERKSIQSERHFCYHSVCNSVVLQSTPVAAVVGYISAALDNVSPSHQIALRATVRVCRGWGGRKFSRSKAPPSVCSVRKAFICVWVM